MNTSPIKVYDKYRLIIFIFKIPFMILLLIFTDHRLLLHYKILDFAVLKTLFTFLVNNVIHL